MKKHKWNLYAAIGWFFVGCINFTQYFTGGFDAALGGVAIINWYISQMFIQKHIEK